MDGVVRIQGGIPTVDATMGRKGMDDEKCWWTWRRK